MREVLYIGIDVDDKMFHMAALNVQTGELIEGGCKPTGGALCKWLEKLKEKDFDLRCCYEATYIGFSLYRFLKEKNIECEVVAPSLIPVLPSDRVKTDRLDSIKLAKYLSKGLLTPVHVPDENDEVRRDLVRSRSFMVSQRSDLKRHILSTLRRYGLDYKSETGKKSYWTKAHLVWLETNLKSVEPYVKVNVEFLLTEYDHLTLMLERYAEELEKISEEEGYKEKVEALSCFKGINRLTALTLITEIGDAKRFVHPKALTSYAGLDIREYSSGGREMKFGITKMGNRRIRTAVVEACQIQVKSLYLSRRVKEARKTQPEKVTEITDRCQKRLKKKAGMMRALNKPNNKIKVACARELLSFVWETLRVVS